MGPMPPSDPSPVSVEKLLPRNERTMIRGRYRRRQLLDHSRRSRYADQSPAERLRELAQEINESGRRRERRAEQLSLIRIDDGLPIAAVADEIEQAIRGHQVIVVTGETGFGKSTQLPLILLRAGLGIEDYIGHTQPRRIAARSIAQRIADQSSSPLGQIAGFKIRFADRLEPNAYIKLMTYGILLAETPSGGEKGVRNHLEIFRTSARAQRASQVETLDDAFRPSLVAIRTAAHGTPAKRRQFCLRLVCVDKLQPSGSPARAPTSVFENRSPDANAIGYANVNLRHA
jgi:hypothetical protein